MQLLGIRTFGSVDEFAESSPKGKLCDGSVVSNLNQFNAARCTLVALPLLQGAKDARLFLVEKLGSGVFTKDRGIEGGSMLESADSLTKLYADNKKMAADQSLVIRTGIEQIDSVVQGMRRKSFNLILGAAGQRKSAMARTIAYNTAARGQRVLFIPLEMSCEEELSIFAIMHGRDENYFEAPDCSRSSGLTTGN